LEKFLVVSGRCPELNCNNVRPLETVA
jgi:hypothetical protein